LTLTIYNDIEQGSDEWLAARCGLLTASQIGKLITPTLQVADNETSRGLTETLVAERITGHVEYVYPSFDMQRGTLDEPYARDMYRMQYGPVDVIGFATRSFGYYTLGASPDGLVGRDGGLEIKSPKPRIHLHTILSGIVPEEHLPQIHTNMLVLDRQWWDFVSYCGGWPLYVKRVHRDKGWDDLIMTTLTAFEIRTVAVTNNYRTAVGDAPIAPRIDHLLDVELKL
jgi:hypothetical protein